MIQAAPTKLRIVHVVLQLDTGGMEKLLVEFARHADRSRFDLRFVSLTTRGPVAAEIEALGWPVTALGIPPGLRPGLVWRLHRLFRAWGADVVQVHNTKPLIYGAPAAQLAGAAVLYMRHGKRFGSGRGENLLFRLTARCADRIVCVSRDSAAQSIQEGLAIEKVSTIWNGIDTRRFDCVGPTAGGPVVMVGRLSAEKDVSTLIRAAALAVAKEPTFRLEIAGDGDCMSSCQEEARRLAVDRSIRFLGNVQDVPGLLARASMCVLPSLTEGISLTILEAMSRGLPVVATRVGGNPEIVVDGMTGRLVPARNPVQLADAMLDVWRNPELGRRMGFAGSERIREHFEVRRMVAEYEAMYLAMAGSAKVVRLPMGDRAIAESQVAGVPLASPE